jgi:hypothetical protein
MPRRIGYDADSGSYRIREGVSRRGKRRHQQWHSRFAGRSFTRPRSCSRFHGRDLFFGGFDLYIVGDGFLAEMAAGASTVTPVGGSVGATGFSGDGGPALGRSFPNA